MNKPTETKKEESRPTFKTLARLSTDFDRMVHDLTTMGKINFSPDFSPDCELKEDASSITAIFDLPGVSKSDVTVDLNGNQLTVSAHRREEKKSESKKSYFSEIRYGSYTRSFTLPSPVLDNKIDAKFANGVLTVTMQKKEMPKSKTIEIQ